MRLLSLDLHVVRALNAASAGALYRIARSQLAREEEPDIIVVRAPPGRDVPVRWFLADAAARELVELRTPDSWALAAHVFLQDEAARLRAEIMARVAAEHGQERGPCPDGR